VLGSTSAEAGRYYHTPFHPALQSKASTRSHHPNAEPSSRTGLRLVSCTAARRRSSDSPRRSTLPSGLRLAASETRVRRPNN
jgi:hypothetical protein